MKTSKVILLKILSALLTLGLIYFLFSSLFIEDITTSLLPGWHTTITPFGGVLQAIIVLLLFSGIAFLVYKLIWRVLSKFWL
ncbi:hypothetical protein [Mucilaginibacter gotjawali]|uniref:Uncharacterized protein n=2 Tax=Mucilaginibacter gotjawali TaxID=1550579 RepID=A0A0X8X5V5_9SPHI|nr:hypothetical protein [Mucilaginibacter gotjawali]MBB3055192.1 putative membrane protein [Mucilaginibacter gotjawali]BAU56189.1 hypothetical protein MgSA37_04386 [Mucilaginibacter gotjawali]